MHQVSRDRYCLTIQEIVHPTITFCHHLQYIIHSHVVETLYCFITYINECIKDSLNCFSPHSLKVDGELFCQSGKNNYKLSEKL